MEYKQCNLFLILNLLIFVTNIFGKPVAQTENRLNNYNRSYGPLFSRVAAAVNETPEEEIEQEEMLDRGLDVIQEHFPIQHHVHHNPLEVLKAIKHERFGPEKVEKIKHAHKFVVGQAENLATFLNTAIDLPYKVAKIGLKKTSDKLHKKLEKIDHHLEHHPHETR